MKTMPTLRTALLCLLVASSALLAKEKDEITDLDAAIKQAAADQKALFIIYGREACSNCQALHGYIDSHQLHLTKSAFLIANLNCDDPAQSKAFRSRYKVNGTTLPFVVVAKPDGSMVASRTGYGSEREFNDFIRDAKKQLK